ncbi:MAG: hypothetical protein K0S74_1490 [Chlamydiales bacterium]|jgi:hypothetical protein|nr:hypothetical protein [Chlamydiales bacterium]
MSSSLAMLKSQMRYKESVVTGSQEEEKAFEITNEDVEKYKEIVKKTFEDLAAAQFLYKEELCPLKLKRAFFLLKFSNKVTNNYFIQMVGHEIMDRIVFKIELERKDFRSVLDEIAFASTVQNQVETESEGKEPLSEVEILKLMQKQKIVECNLSRLDRLEENLTALFS